MKKSLIGRWVKALRDNPNGGLLVKKGDYGQIIKEGIVRFPNDPTYFWSNVENSCNAQLMPEGFDPKKESDPGSEWIPQLGEWVVIINQGCKLSGCPDVSTKPGQLYESSRKNYYHNFVLNGIDILFNKGEAYRFLRKATAEEIARVTNPKSESMNEFKEGDWFVKTHDQGWLDKGEVAQVLRVSGGTHVYYHPNRCIESKFIRKALAHEIPGKPGSDSKDELLARAKREYQPGTWFKALQTGSEYEVIGEPYWEGGVIWHRGAGRIYENGEWAQIISRPGNSSKEDLLAEAKRRYPVGTKVKKLGQNIGGDFGYEVRFSKHSVHGRNTLYVDGNLLLCYEGQWAEIVKEAPAPQKKYDYSDEDVSPDAQREWKKIGKEGRGQSEIVITKPKIKKDVTIDQSEEVTVSKVKRPREIVIS